MISLGRGMSLYEFSILPINWEELNIMFHVIMGRFQLELFSHRHPIHKLSGTTV